MNGWTAVPGRNTHHKIVWKKTEEKDVVWDFEGDDEDTCVSAFNIIHTKRRRIAAGSD